MTTVAAPSAQPHTIPEATTRPVAAPTIRVLHVVNGEHYAGAERVQDLLARRLPAAGVSVAFACLKPGQFVRARESDVPLFEVPMRNRFDLRAVWRLVRIVREGKFDLLHSHSTRTALVAGLASQITGVPLVHHVHSPAARDTTHRIRCSINARVEKWVLGRAAALVAVSASLGRYLRDRGFPADRLFVVPNGVPAKSPIPARSAAKTDWTLGMVALFRPRKGFEVLLHAIKQLRNRGLPVRLRAIGGFETENYRSEILRLVASLGLDEAVQWVGFTKEVDAELAKVDLLVLPSLFGEGLPMVVLEAMAAGVPVVATRVEGVPEAIRHGKDGLIVEPNDPGDLAAALKRIIDGEADWNQIRLSARRRHAESFSDTAMADNVAEVYRRVLKQK